MSGFISYDENTCTAIFTPDALLDCSVFTATITTGVKDLAGNSLSADKVWNFTTTTCGHHEAYLKAPNNSDMDYFGYDVAISGDTIVVGAPTERSNTSVIINGSNLSTTNDSGNENGAAYVFIRSGLNWSFQAYLKAPNNSNGDYFGNTVAISGDTIVVGSPYEDSSTNTIINSTDLSTTNNDGNNNGAVYVFVRSDSTWSHQAYLKAPNNSDIDSFGWSVAISGDTIAVGVSNEDSTTTSIINGSNLSETDDSGDNNGAVYVFTRSDNLWSHQAYLKAPNNSDMDAFGYSVAISGDTITVGARYEDSTTTSIINGSILSATNDNGNQNGAVYVFTRSDNLWSLQAYLKAPNNSDMDYFGQSVAVSGDTIAVGTPLEDSTTTSIINGSILSATNDNGNQNGAVYVFTRSGNLWSHQAYLKAPNNTDMNVLDCFGDKVAMSGDTIIVGVTNEDSTTTSIINGPNLSATNREGSTNGAVYLFTRSGGIWSHLAYLKAPNNSNEDYFGESVNISGSTIVAGALQETSTTTDIINGSDLSTTNNNGFRNGAAYVFVLP